MKYIATVKSVGGGETSTVLVNDLNDFWQSGETDYIGVDFGQNGESNQAQVFKCLLELVSIEKVS